MYEIGILDDKYNYYEHEIQILCSSITPTLKKSLDKLFNNYLVDKNTEINFLKGIEKIEPIYMYFSIINQHVFANIRICDPDVIPRRICAYHPSYIKHNKFKSLKKSACKKLWEKLLKYDKCPWINSEVDAKLKNQSDDAAARNRFLRISLYYLVIKRFLVDHVLELKHKREQNITS